jgi:hypothetical protein
MKYTDMGKEDITKCSDDELWIRIDDNDDMYELKSKPLQLVKYVKENYIYTTEQMETLLTNSWWEYQDSIKYVEFW